MDFAYFSEFPPKSLSFHPKLAFGRIFTHALLHFQVVLLPRPRVHMTIPTRKWRNFSRRLCGLRGLSCRRKQSRSERMLESPWGWGLVAASGATRATLRYTSPTSILTAVSANPSKWRWERIVKNDFNYDYFGKIFKYYSLTLCHILIIPLTSPRLVENLI